METPKDKLKKLGVSKHQWVSAHALLETETANYPVCQRCGIVQNEKNKDKPCRGIAHLRAPEKPIS
jgi:hypothetical protein